MVDSPAMFIDPIFFCHKNTTTFFRREDFICPAPSVPSKKPKDHPSPQMQEVEWSEVGGNKTQMIMEIIGKGTVPIGKGTFLGANCKTSGMYDHATLANSNLVMVLLTLSVP